jgi:hypothetical protein
MTSHYKRALIKWFNLGSSRAEHLSACSDIECDNMDALESIIKYSNAISVTVLSKHHNYPESLALIPRDVPGLKTNYCSD